MSSSKMNKLLISYLLVRRHTTAALRISRQGEMPIICQNVEGETIMEVNLKAWETTGYLHVLGSTVA